MARIDINNHSVTESRQEFIASVYQACHELFKGGNMVISISKNTELRDISKALANISEILEVGALMVSHEKKEEDEKHDGYDGWLSPDD